MCPFTMCVVVLVFLFSISRQQQQKIKCQRVEMREQRNTSVELGVCWLSNGIGVVLEENDRAIPAGLSSNWIYFLKRTGAAATTKASTREKSSWESFFPFLCVCCLDWGFKSFKKKKKKRWKRKNRFPLLVYTYRCCPTWTLLHKSAGMSACLWSVRETPPPRSIFSVPKRRRFFWPPIRLPTRLM